MNCTSKSSLSSRIRALGNRKPVMPRFHLEELAKYEESAEYQGLKIANSSKKNSRSRESNTIETQLKLIKHNNQKVAEG